MLGAKKNVSNVTVTLDETNPEKEQQPTRAHIIVVGNAKGGSGKSTTAMHVIVSLLTMGFKVGAIDLDGKQKTLGRYLENRQNFIAKKKLQLPMPSIRVIEPSPKKNMDEAQTDERARFVAALQELVYENNFVVVDEILTINIFQTGTIASEENSNPAQFGKR